MRPKNTFPERVLIKNGKTQKIEIARVTRYYVRRDVPFYDVITEKNAVYLGITPNPLQELTYLYKTL
jgi:hypothetical protein